MYQRRNGNTLQVYSPRNTTTTAFPAMFGKVRAMMNAAGFDKIKETITGQKQCSH